MKVKVCYKEEIHRISNLPEAFEDLVTLIPTIFHSQLPDSWTLQYKDSDGDLILITDEKDYEEFKNSEPGTASAMSKIHVISAESFKVNNAVVNKSDIIELEPNEIKRDEDYQVIDEREDKDENKPEEMIELKEEVPEAVPVQEEQEKEEPKEIEEKEEIIQESEVQEEPRELEEQQDEQYEEQERKEPEEPEKAEEQDDVKAPEELHEPEEVIEKEVQEEKEEKEEEPKVEEPELKEEEEEKQPVEEEPKVEEEEVAKPAEEKPVEDREEQKSNVMESQYSKILGAPREEIMKESYEMVGSKFLVGPEDLKSLVSSIIAQKMPEIAQFTQQQIEESRSQMSQSMMMDQSLLISDEFRPKPAAPKIIHYDTKCMGCGMAPIQGVRYKCTICPSFDYCEQCEESGTHPHNFVKMRQRDVQDIFRPPQQLKPVVPDWKKLDMNVPKQEMKESIKQKPGQDAKHYDKLVETAKKLQKCFPKEDFDMLCVFINDCPDDMSIEELVENYKLGMKKD